MNGIAVLILVVVIALPIGWFFSEFGGNRAIRMVLGIGAILSSFGVAYLAGSLEMFNADAWFGSATKDLVDTTIVELDRGNDKQVIARLKELQAAYTPNYDSRSRYDVLVQNAVKKMKETPK